ncbi:butyrophilin subfamily 1 member A1-like [Hoplias malabaricus]|uniref:butyrophilin subfamily 1 member A1-like n=1 Tax=Hoplias malabaricus TaxID=27720 RepID=UPI003461D2DB
MILIFLATVLSCSAEEFSILVPEGSVSENLGSSAVLSCALSPSLKLETIEVRWYKNQNDNPVLLYKDLKVQDNSGDPQYRGRVSLIGELEKGNISLKLENLKLTDSGEYVCFVKSNTWYDKANVNLTVKVLGSSPMFSLAEAGDQVNVTCASGGWSPKPILIWRDKEGRELRSRYVYYRTDSEGLVSVSSWLLLSPSVSEWISCSVGLSDQEIKNSRVLPVKGVWREAFISTLALSLIIVLFLTAILLKSQGLIPHCTPVKDAKEVPQKHNDTSQESTTEETCSLTGLRSESSVPEVLAKEQLKTWKRLKKHKEKLTIDPVTSTNKPLNITQGGTGVYCGNLDNSNLIDSFPHVLSREEFSSGLKYWEVTVNSKDKDKLSWCVGVTQKPPTKETLTALCYEDHCGIYSSSKPHTQIPAEGHVTNLGLLLNFSEHTLSFFNVEEESHLHTFTINNMENNNYYALISPGIKDSFPVKFL